MLGKKGMSPIIATILLIAFAVALGAMIMNWSSSLVAGGALDTTCKSIDLRMRSPVCLANNQIRLDILNAGETEISSVVLKVKGPDSDQDVNLRNSHLMQGDILTKSIPFVSSEGLSADFLINVDSGEGERLCPEPAHTVPNIPGCK